MSTLLLPPTRSKLKPRPWRVVPSRTGAPWFWHKARRVFLMAEGSGSTLRGVLGGTGSLTGSTGWDVTGAGRAALVDADNEGVSTPSSAIDVNSGTVLMFGVPGWAGGGDLSVSRYFFDSDTARHAFYLAQKLSPDTVQMYNDGRVRDFDSSPIRGGRPNLFGFDYDKAADLQQPYVDGTPLALVSGPSGTWGSNALGANVYFGRRFNGAETFQGHIVYAVTADLLTAAEHAALAADPFAPFRQRQQVWAMERVVEASDDARYLTLAAGLAPRLTLTADATTRLTLDADATPRLTLTAGMEPD